MCCGAAGTVAGAAVCEGWDKVVDVVIVDCSDGGAIVTVVGVVLLTWEVVARSEGCRLGEQMVM